MNLRSIIRAVKMVWEAWDVRAFMVMSLLFQISLVLVAPFRRRKSSYWLRGILFCLYLLADWSANYASAVIFNSRNDAKHKDDQLPLAFWCAFVLVHLGGADSITAFSLQDNNFWHRHALSMVFQAITSIYIFIITLQRNNLWILTILVFISGFIKYLERIMSLYSARFNKLRDSLRKTPDPGPPYSKIMEVYRGQRDANLPSKTDIIDALPRSIYLRGNGDPKISPHLITLHARHFFQTVQRFVVDLKCSCHERKQSREFFLGLTTELAFKVIALELNFLYEILFTKAIVLRTRRGLYLRLVSFASMVSAFGLFYYDNKENQQSDVAISYALLVSAILFDLIAFSYIIAQKYYFASYHKVFNPNWLIDNPSYQPSTPKKQRFGRIGKFIGFPKGSWSESVSRLGLIEYRLSSPSPECRKILDRIGVSEYFDEVNYVISEPLKNENELKSQIFNQVKLRSKLVAEDDLDQVKEASKARGDWTIRSEHRYSHLLDYVVNMDYDESLLTWHIATELCWWSDKVDEDCKKRENANEDCKKRENAKEDCKKRENAKVLSDYMMYLVKMHPSIMYGVTDIGQTRLLDTCAEIDREKNGVYQKEPSPMEILKYAFHKCLKALKIWIITPVIPLYVLIFGSCPNQSKMEDKDEHNEMEIFCKKILGVCTEVNPVSVKGDKSKSVLFDGCRLAKELQKLESDKWEIMSKVWVEMLCYAAVHCRPQMLAQPLSSGGELVSFVWVLMAHFGLVDQFEVDRPSRAKMTFDK